MKKLINLSLLTTTLLTTVGAGCIQVFAATEADNAQANANVKINPGDGKNPAEPPVSPTDPGDNTGHTGTLTITFASHLDFGDIKLGTTNIEQSPTNILNSNNQPLHMGIGVNDERGAGTGWHVNVSLSKFIGTDNPTHELKGAQIMLPAGTMTDGSVSLDAPVSYEATMEADGKSVYPLINAEVGKGMGNWFDDMDPSQIKLKAPGGQYSDTYTATMSFILNDAPQ